MDRVDRGGIRRGGGVRAHRWDIAPSRTSAPCPARARSTGHVALGLGATALALLHTFGVLPALGSSAAIRGGMGALGPGTVAFFLLFAHVGVGLKLRDPKLKSRAKVRRTHVALAIGIAVAVATHVAVLVGAS